MRPVTFPAIDIAWKKAMVNVKEEDVIIVEVPTNHVHRKLQARLLQMIALGATIGTGLFVASGSTIVSAGPAGGLLSYVIVGFLVHGVVTALGEMSTLYPISGSFNVYASRFVEQSLGFSMGWNYWASWAITNPAELSAGGMIIQYWLPSVQPVIIVILTAINMVGVRGFGELEYWLSLIKVIAIVIFIIIGISAVCGAFPSVGKLGFTYWISTDHHPHWTPSSNGLAGIAYAFPTAFYSFGGTELVGITAGEAADPRETVPKAIRGTFWRIILFYVMAIVLVGLLIPQDDPGLVDSAGDITTAPFVLAYEKIGIAGAANVMNAVSLIALLSAANSSIYAASRTLMGMAESGLAPKICGLVDKRGVPWVSLAISVLIACISFLSSLFGNGLVFSYLVNIMGIASLLTWIAISVTHLRFRAAYKAQGFRLADLPFRTRTYPFNDIFAIFISFWIIASLVYAAVTSPFVDPYTYYDSSLYVGIPLFTIMYFGHKLYTRSPLIPLTDIDLITDRYVDEVSTKTGVPPAKIIEPIP
ncbi:hypothetical protein SmJEL517_g03064 [Synchytrium microbalum]|uniref:Amino acid permease/ SLC12A domain-containing protein n=1 Tax=Synchytrium microbalum TaxID=1806994 RepID=A0A507BZL5_9FUNG|nr:uncharacterized protein SmJEL517_g03064 [Synchytrium microbalum]TPX34247.1 hypothetical protein SmJEL517_g03064 [Synchytrium microbalum]